MAVKYGLTRDGFKRKRLPEIMQSLRDRLSDRLGIKIERGANSLLGQIIGVYAYECADLWEQAEHTYNAMYPSTAQGVQLSNSAGLAGIAQITAEQTTLLLTCYGMDGTAIPYGAQVSSMNEPDIIYTCTDADAVISAGKCATADVKVIVSPGIAYGLTINGQGVMYTAGQGATATIVLNGLAAQLSIAGLTTRIVNDVLTLAMDDPRNTFAMSGNNITIDNIGTPVNFMCEKYGAVNPAIGTVTNIVTAVHGWAGARNNIAANVGRENESDTALRQRWSSSIYDRASAMVEAIQAKIYANVAGVSTCKVYENASDATDEYGRPPHSVEVVVAGGKHEDIVAQIWKAKAGGIDTFGTESAACVDSQGVTHTLKFNRPEVVPIWLKITISENPEETFPAGGVFDIANALLARGNTQSVGEDVVLQKYFSTIFKATTGVGYIQLTAATGKTPGNYEAKNIIISPRQIASFAPERIEVKKV
jgi:hypothetical protein|nr:MAG TPA: Baseplate wedge protein [Caudoviricetes sp.]